MTPDPAKPNTLKGHTLAQLRSMPKAQVAKMLEVELKKRQITIQPLSPETRATVVADVLEQLQPGFAFVFVTDDMFVSRNGDMHKNELAAETERELLIALWRQAPKPKAGRKRLEQYNLDELLAMSSCQDMDDLLNLCYYGFLGGGTCKRSSDDSIVGQNLKKLRELVGAFTFWVWTPDEGQDEWRIDWPSIDFVIASVTPAHCVATALLVAYWLKLKAEEEVPNA